MVKIVKTATGQTVGITYPKNSVYICPNCGKEFKTEEGLKRHTEKEHK